MDEIDRSESFKFQFPALGGANEIQISAESKTLAESAALAAISIVRGIETKYSRYQEKSVISRINASAGKHAVEVDHETRALLGYAHECYLQSGGLFDITSGVLRRAWDFKEAQPPTQREISALLPLIDWNSVQLDDHSIYLPMEGMEIDFGGIGKEYAADCAARALRERGITRGFVNLGGDIVGIGGATKNRGWSIGIVHPRVEGATVAGVELHDGALATSGDYERFFYYRGKRYSHLLNPKSGWSVEDTFQSVTISCSSCLVAGTIATIAMLKGEEEGLRYLRERTSGGLVVDSKGNVFQVLGESPEQPNVPLG